MEEQIINFETAKLASEKGIKLKEYSGSGIIINKVNIGSYNDEDYVWLCKQSRLQKVLRDKHNLDITIALVGHGYGFYIHNNKKYTNRGESYGVSGNTYEEALEVALKTALELIK